VGRGTEEVFLRKPLLMAIAITSAMTPAATPIMEMVVMIEIAD
jgi:hypothetical protein